MIQPSIFEVLETRKLFSTWTVTSLADDGSSGTLRSVISSAESSSGSQTIQFDSSLTSAGPATITLNGNALELNHSSETLTIQGPSNNPLTIAHDSSVLLTVGDFAVVSVDSGTTASISNLTLTGGYKSALRDLNLDGGGIDDYGTLTVTACTITGNVAQNGGAIYQSGSGPLEVINSTITDNAVGNAGGAILGTHVNVSNSTISNNYASIGGGLCGAGTLVVTGSAIIGNTASDLGGGIVNDLGCSMFVGNCTIANNQGDDGSGIDSGYGATIVDCTITGNSSPDSGSGVYNFDSSDGPVIIQGSIVAGNGQDLNAGFFGVESDVIGDDYSDDGAYFDNADGIWGPTMIWGADPQLAPLGYYGGPTETMPPMPGSPAIGSFQSTALWTSQMSNDQRGFSMGDDIGAFQTQSSPLEVNTASDDPVGSGYLSLRDAVNLASAMGGDQTVTFASSLTASSSATLNLSNSAIALDDTTGTLTINASGASHSVIVNAASGEDAFDVDSGSTAELNSLAINGTVSATGTLTADADTNATTNSFAIEVQNGGMLKLPSSIDIGALTIDAGGFAQETSTDTAFGDEVITLGSLTLGAASGSTNGGLLDLGNGDLIAQQTSSSAIESLLAAGYDGGAWDGVATSGPNPAAIVSSTAAQLPQGLATLSLAQVGSGSLDISTFDGQSVSSGDTVVALICDNAAPYYISYDPDDASDVTLDPQTPTGLQITATSSNETFTLVLSGSTVYIYPNDTETGTPVASVAASSFSTLIINGATSTTVDVDSSGGSPLPGEIEIATGDVTFSQSLGSVDVVVEPNASVAFTTEQSLDSLTIFPAASATFVIAPTEDYSPDAEGNNDFFAQAGAFLNGLGKAITDANNTLRDNHLPYVDISITPDPDHPGGFIITVISWKP